MEHFGSISDMIGHWEGMEERETEKEEVTVKGGGKKRLSRRISELSGSFEGEGERGKISQSGGRDILDFQIRKGQEGELLTFSNISKLPQMIRCKTRDYSVKSKVDQSETRYNWKKEKGGRFWQPRSL